MGGKTIGQYRVLDRLGHGGMGSVYRATDEMLDRPVALKILEAGLEDSSSRLRAEAAALARLSHPGIATLYELLEDDGRLVMVMELVRGQTLHQIVEQVGVFSPQRAAELCMQALEALAHAHSAGVVHRDLKPGNLMLTETGTIKILDFGIARLDGAVHLTRVGSMMGTPAYMAPEQVLGTAVDSRADLYAMGVVFYRLISAELPFRGETPFEMAQSQVNDAPTPIKLVRPDLPAWASDIIARALAKAPEQRFQSALEFHEALARCLAGTPCLSAGSAGEPTEVMVRPVLPAARPVAAPGAGAGARRGVAWIQLAAAAFVVGVGAWLLVPAGVAPSQAAAGDPPRDAPVSIVSPAAPERAAVQPVIATPPPAAVSRAARPTPASEELTVSNALPVAVFKEMKWLLVNGTRTSATDVVLTFSTDEMSAVPATGSRAVATLPYRQIAKATYVYARDPLWNPAFGAPSEKLDVPGILGRSRHWLVLQTTDTYAILRLDGSSRQEVLTAVEARSGVTIDRPSAAEKSPGNPR